MDAPRHDSYLPLPGLLPLACVRPEGRVYGRAWRLLGPCRHTACQDACFLPLHGDSKLYQEAASQRLEATARYLPYLARAKQLLISSTRYIAYSSDIGESLRPVLKPWHVNLSYGIAGGYVVCETDEASTNQAVVAVCAHTAVFQFVASLALPAVIIHTVVRQAQLAIDTPSVRRWPRLFRYGPSSLGLSIVPFLPLLDPACEQAVDVLFDTCWPSWRK
mmetsp:Transcript_4067/g.7401  ORF Transcript_4067/g.7401 Transcript_4067/m.7401 type:complete len:219 (+) Transcript_4067:72-728(+)